MEWLVPLMLKFNSFTDLEFANISIVNIPSDTENLEYDSRLVNIQLGAYPNPNWRYPPNTLTWLKPTIFEIIFFISLIFF